MQLTEQEIQYVKAAFDTAIKHSPDAMAAAQVLTAIYAKLTKVEAASDNQSDLHSEPN